MVITEEDDDGEENKENEDEEKRQRKRRKLTHLINKKCSNLLVNLIWSLSLSPYGGKEESWEKPLKWKLVFHQENYHI